MVKLTDIELSKINRIIIKSKVAEHVKKGGITQLIDNWKELVNECIKGYHLTIYDYTNDLDGRSIIFDAIDKTNDITIVKKVNLTLSPLDAKFKKLLIETDKCILGEKNKKKYPKEKYWWYWGIVKNAKGELLQDLRHEHFNYYKN